jgi:predicted membrane channel-forming protein YqfA (hemolysin III family)
MKHQPSLTRDNKSAIFLTLNPISHKQSKHIVLDYHFICELIAASAIQPEFVLDGSC